MFSILNLNPTADEPIHVDGFHTKDEAEDFVLNSILCDRGDSEREHCLEQLEAIGAGLDTALDQIFEDPKDPAEHEDYFKYSIMETEKLKSSGVI